MLDVREDVPDPRRVTELEENISESTQLDHRTAVVLVAGRQVRPSVSEVENLKVRTVGQCS